MWYREISCLIKKTAGIDYVHFTFLDLSSATCCTLFRPWRYCGVVYKIRNLGERISVGYSNPIQRGKYFVIFYQNIISQHDKVPDLKKLEQN